MTPALSGKLAAQAPHEEDTEEERAQCDVETVQPRQPEKGACEHTAREREPLPDDELVVLVYLPGEKAKPQHEGHSKEMAQSRIHHASSRTACFSFPKG